MTVDEGATVAECCQLVVLSAGLQGAYHIQLNQKCLLFRGIIIMIKLVILWDRMKRPL